MAPVPRCAGNLRAPVPGTALPTGSAQLFELKEWKRAHGWSHRFGFSCIQLAASVDHGYFFKIICITKLSEE